MKTTSHRAAIVYAVIIGSSTEGVIAQPVILYGLGDLPGGDRSSHASAVSADGRTIVGASKSSNGFEGFVWSAESGMIGVGDLPSGQFNSTASSISASGQFVVGRGIVASGNEGFLWSASDGITGVGDLPGGNVFSEAYDVSDNRIVVGVSASAASSAEAFRWTPESGMTPMGFLPSGSFPRASTAHAITGDGMVIAGASSSVNAGANSGEAFRWTAATGMVGLGDLPGASFRSGALGMSDNGRYVVGNSSSLRPFVNQGRNEAFLWTEGAGMVGLGTMHMDNDGTSRALDVSDFGHVVGSASYGNELFETAFYWTPERGMVSIRDLLLEHGIDADALGWQFSSATGISADGLTIVGNGSSHFGNVIEGWVVHLPSPAATPLLLLAAAGVMAGRRR